MCIDNFKIFSLVEYDSSVVTDNQMTKFVSPWLCLYFSCLDE
jgi:hypothetical protein